MRALIEGLPPESALYRAHTKGWTQTDELLATLIQVVDQSNRLFVQVHSKPNSAVPPPIEIRRPWEPEPEAQPKPSTADDVKRVFGLRYVGPPAEVS